MFSHDSDLLLWEVGGPYCLSKDSRPHSFTGSPAWPSVSVRAGSWQQLSPGGSHGEQEFIISSICGEEEGIAWGPVLGRGDCHMIPGAHYGESLWFIWSLKD